MLKIFILSLILSANAYWCFAQNQPPVVQNVNFMQRDDGSFIVDIYYDVNDPEGDALIITMKVSNNGVTWSFPCTLISGDIGPQSSGTNKHIVWDFGTEHPQRFGDQFRIKIIANDWSNSMGVPCPGLPTITYEGKIYNTVQIGDQCWLKENLDVGIMINGNSNLTNNGVIEKYCYNNDSNYCNFYGGLYSWNEAMQYSTTPGTQGICPPGWHIPTLAEFQTLKNVVNFDCWALLAVGQGAGTNTSGFSAFLAGRKVIGYTGLGEHGDFWSSTQSQYNNSRAYSMSLSSLYELIYLHENHLKGTSISIRCLKD